MESDTNSGCAIPSVYANRCPLILALDMIGGKWKLPIVWYLSKSETLRFNELRRRVSGVTSMMLSKCLRELESDGIVTRTEFSSIPPHVEYSLTNSTKALVPILHGLYAWAEEHVASHRTPHSDAPSP
ncbi:MAG: helix-turn-helix transcriptional regulator [Desulfovibrio sp.]|nr:helix-turn-helix transcriptional regulator [Desulfovibrio sp.]